MQSCSYVEHGHLPTVQGYGRSKKKPSIKDPKSKFPGPQLFIKCNLTGNDNQFRSNRSTFLHTALHSRLVIHTLRLL